MVREQFFAQHPAKLSKLSLYTAGPYAVSACFPHPVGTLALNVDPLCHTGFRPLQSPLYLRGLAEGTSK